MGERTGKRLGQLREIKRGLEREGISREVNLSKLSKSY